VYAGGERDSGSIYRIDPNGGDAQQISHYRAALLAFSPDGRRVIFMSECDYNCDLFVMDADGANMHQLTQNGLFDVFPAWSPDSQYITFMSNRDRYFEIYVLDVDCATLPGGCLGNIRRLTINRDFDGFPAWSPDGKVVVFSSDRSGEFELYTVDADCAPEPEQCEETVRRLTDHPQRDLSPTWSPDGSRIAFISGRDVYVMDADGANIRFIARDVLPDQFLAWRP
jgi:TolB protein